LSLKSIILVGEEEEEENKKGSGLCRFYCTQAIFPRRIGVKD